jgi:MFS family permease
MQGLLGSSALISGVALAALSVSMPFGGFVASRLVFHMSYRVSSTMGGVILTVGSLLLIWLHPGATPWQPIIATGTMGLGMGIMNVSSVVAIQANVDWSQRGAATSSIFFSRIIGQSFGSALFGGIFNSGLASRGSINGNEFVHLLQEGHAQIANIPGIAAILDASAHALHSIYLLTGLIAVLMLAAALSFPPALRLLDER